MTNSGDATVINDRYEIHKRIGRGGMADVFLARDRLLDRQVAIKVLFPEFAIDPNFVERFRREAQAAANLSHPNIVNVYDWGKYEGTYFIAMEYVQGRTLAEILRDQQAAHRQAGGRDRQRGRGRARLRPRGRLVHRDIKPANILIGSNGQVKVADFGIARAMNAPTESNLTQAGAVMGTATYFSPEQAQGAQPDPRSDLYSLGIVMYEMVAGRPPFTGENPVSIAYKQVHDAAAAAQPDRRRRPPRRSRRSSPSCSPRTRACATRRADALRDDLRRFRNGEPVQALVPRPPAAARLPTVAAPSTTVDAVAGTAQRRRPSRPPMAAADDGADRGPAEPPVTALPAPAPRRPPATTSDHHSRTGWYALAAFVALIALAVGGVLLLPGARQGEPTTRHRRSPLDGLLATSRLDDGRPPRCSRSA